MTRIRRAGDGEDISPRRGVLRTSKTEIEKRRGGRTAQWMVKRAAHYLNTRTRWSVRGLVVALDRAGISPRTPTPIHTPRIGSLTLQQPHGLVERRLPDGPMHSRLGTRLIAASMLLLTLGVSRADVPTAEQDCRNRNSALCEAAGVEFVVDGPCPATARTIRPQGLENCDTVAAQITREPAPSPSGNPAANRPSTPRQDLAWVGQMERWLLPALVLVGGVLVIGAAAWAFRRLYANRRAGDSARRAGRSVIQLVAAATIAVLLAWQAAGAAFNRIFGSYDNHDTAAPLLIAAPVAFSVFVLVLPAVFAASVWILRLLGKAFRTSP